MLVCQCIPTLYEFLLKKQLFPSEISTFLSLNLIDNLRTR